MSIEYPEFLKYFQLHLQQHLRDYVNVPSKCQLNHDRLWTNNNCESINHVFKRAINWTPKSIPELIKSLHNIVKVLFLDIKRSLYGTVNFELFSVYRKHPVSYQAWQSKTEPKRTSLPEVNERHQF